MSCLSTCSTIVARNSLRCSLFRVRMPPVPPLSLQVQVQCARLDRLTAMSPPCVLVTAHSGLHTSTVRPFACDDSDLTEAQFQHLVTETLDSLAESLEALPDLVACDADFDITLGDGVLTLHLGQDLGTYVINKQIPNRQIWLSSPTSGPKRYDLRDSHWIYSRENEGLHTLLERELSAAFKTPMDLSSCAFYT